MLRLEHCQRRLRQARGPARRVACDVLRGRTTVILGANGAGKTTLLKTIAGLVRPQPGGRILFEDRPIENEPTHRIVAAGIALVPEGRRLFGEMTVIDNLRIGAYTPHARADAAEPAREAARAVPAARRAPQPARPHHERRRAADAGDRPRADVGAEAPAARRAVARPRPAPGQGPVRDPRARSRAAASRWCWSSRTCTRACAWRIGSTCWRTAASCAPAPPPRSRTTRRSSRPISAWRPQRNRQIGAPHGPILREDLLTHSRVPSRQCARPNDQEDRAMAHQLESSSAGSGFFHPFARSISPAANASSRAGSRGCRASGPAARRGPRTFRPRAAS